VKRCVGLWVLMAALAGCGDDAAEADLRGSVSRIYPLGFAHTRARRGASELAVQWVAADGQVPVQVVLRSPDTLGPGAWRLPEHGDVLGTRDDRELPALSGGEVQLSAFEPTPGGRVAGAVQVTLVGGYSLIGVFEAEVEDVAP